MAASGNSSQSDNKNNKGNGGSESSGMQGNAGASAAEAVGQVQDTMSGLKDQVKQQASEQLSSRLETAVGGLEMAAKVLRTASDQVRLQDKTGIANSLSGTADRIEGWSTSLREQDVDKLLEETKQLAQRNPALFVGGATVLGFLGARFLTSSSKPQETSTSGESGTSQAVGTDVSSMSTATSDVDTTSSYQTAEDMTPLAASFDETLGEDDITVVDDTLLEADVMLDDTVLEADVLLDDTMLESDLGESSLDRTGSSTRPEDR